MKTRPLPTLLTIALLPLVATAATAGSLSTFDDDGLAAQSAAPPANATGNGSLTTLFAQNNGFRGTSFDLLSSTCLEVVGWDFNFTNAAGVTGNVSVYWRVGTADGFESTPVGWTLLGTAPVTTAGNNQPTHFDVGGLVLQPGELVGIYYYVDDYPNPRTGYTNGSNLYSNLDLALQTLRGIGTTTPFGSGGLFNDRQVNVTVHYDTDSPLCGHGGGGGSKTRLCHLPPGNTANGHVIEVGDPAVDAHIAHGDCLVSGGVKKGDCCTCP